MRIRLLLVLGTTLALFQETEKKKVIPEYLLEELEKEFADPLPQTTFDPAKATGRLPVRAFPKEDDVRLIGRISQGVKKIGYVKGGGRWWTCWWTCGEIVKPEEEDDLALKWAYRIVYLAWEYSDNNSDDGITINPWGIFGTAANESGFDICALGPWPRKWGYDNKTIKKRKLCISHPYSEIKATMLHPKGIERWKTSGIDAAPLHQLWRCDEKGMCKPKFNHRDRLPPIPLDEVFSLGKGFEYNVRKMKKDAIDFKTDRPWLYWPGHRSTKYDEKVTRWARKGGATKDEI
jgi:hypothetical protein